ncbi:MAG: hypothetical protein J0I47_14525 [Sphingomonas sp.]|nr:hypothetical protein [Sphingomonas sp.]MBN8809432.1 hypothetical protein [Sphingomonas sp.]
MPTNDERAARLAAQLRANLRRRKEQARGLGDTPRDAGDSARDDASEREA